MSDADAMIVAGAVWRFGSGLFHGALVSMSPDGAGRLTDVLDEGHANSWDAVADVTASTSAPARHPHRRHLPPMLFADMPRGAVVTGVSEKGSTRKLPTVVEVECRIGGRHVDHGMTPQALSDLVRAGALTVDSGSGDDHRLAYRYDHYVQGRPPSL